MKKKKKKTLEALTKTISEKDARIRQLEMKVDTLEEEMDKHEQYTRGQD